MTRAHRLRRTVRFIFWTPVHIIAAVVIVGALVH